MPFTWQLPYAWPRTPVLASNMVCTSQPLAAQAGLAMLAAGGNAVDAAIATAITLTVVEPVSNGIGSDAFAMVWDGTRLHGLNASGRSPAGWSPEYFRGGGVPELGWNSVTVPGAVSGWAELHTAFGTLPFEKLFEPAIGYARNGFLVSPRVARQWAAQVPALQLQPGFAQTFMPGGRAPHPGELVRLDDHAATLEAIATTHGEAFYRGRLAEQLHAHCAAHGGVLSADDLAAHRVDWVAPMSQGYRDYALHEIPPNGQGIVALIALGILEHFEMAGPDDADSVHLQIEAVKLAFADAYSYVADIDHMRISPQDLLDPEYLRRRAMLIDRTHAQPASAGAPGGGTVLLSTADATGMMVSMIQSNYRGFGSGVVVPGTGIALHNRGSGFVATAGHPNQVGPNKRTFHTIIPAMLSTDGMPVMSFGVMGAPIQPQAQVQVVTRIVDHDQNPQAACDGPRFRWIQDMQVAVESSFPSQTLDELRRRGHQLVVAEAGDDQFGSCQAIWRLADGYLGVSDPRRDGQAAGF